MTLYKAFPHGSKACVHHRPNHGISQVSLPETERELGNIDPQLAVDQTGDKLRWVTCQLRTLGSVGTGKGTWKDHLAFTFRSLCQQKGAVYEVLPLPVPRDPVETHREASDTKHQH